MPRLRPLIQAGAALTLALFALLATGLPGALNRTAFDSLTRLFANPARAHPDALLVLIDEDAIATAARRGERWPWPRESFAALLLALHQAGARAIAADLLFLEPSEDAYQDDLLASAVAATGTHLAALNYRQPVLRPVDGSPLPPTGLVEYHPDSDGVIRHYIYPLSLAQTVGQPDFPQWKYLVLLRWPAGTTALGRQALGAGPLIDHGRALLHSVRATGADELDPTALRHALATLPPLHFGGELRGKTVFIGASHAAGFDLKPFPIGPREPGVLVHFTAWSNAMNRDYFRQLRGLDLVIALALTAFFLIFHWHQTHLVTLTTIATLLTLTLLAVTLAGAYFGFWFPPALPVLALALTFTTLTVRHWNSENQAQRRLSELFSSYVSPAVLRRLQEHPDRLRLGGERRDVTVYFSDVAGFTELAERCGPETLVTVMNEYFGEMSDILIQHGGYLDKYIGDAVMAVFGAPDDQPDHAVAACRAALACRDRLAALAPAWAARHGVRLSARAGLNTGTAIAGNIGSARKRSYTVLGDCVNLASRLEGANKAYGTSILAGPETVRQAGHTILFRPVDLLRVKGKSHAALVHEPLAPTELASPAQTALAHDHAAAWAHLQARRFQNAFDAYQALLARDAGDLLAQEHARRCRSYLDNPPPPDWDGIHHLKDK